MKNMALLIDSNVVNDFLSVREPNYRFASSILEVCKLGEVRGYIAFHTLPTIWYTLRRNKPSERREMLLGITGYLTVISVPHETVVEALLDMDFKDFEDCLQEKCAIAANVDYIVTENTRDFTASSIPAVTALEMMKILCDMDGESSC